MSLSRRAFLIRYCRFIAKKFLLSCFLDAFSLFLIVMRTEDPLFLGVFFFLETTGDRSSSFISLGLTLFFPLETEVLGASVLSIVNSGPSISIRCVPQIGMLYTDI